MNDMSNATQSRSGFGLDPRDELNDLRMSEKAVPLLDHVRRFIADTVQPMSEKFFSLGEGRADRWSYAPGQLDLLEEAKDKAKEEGLWNFFLPDAETGEGLANLDYAYIAIELGKNPLASEVMNCSAPDTGNMEVLERVGTKEQKDKWLKPLLEGKIRSAFAMTEPVCPRPTPRTSACRPSSKVTNGSSTARNTIFPELAIRRCKIMIVMVKTSPDAPSHLQQSQILVPIDTKGVEIVGPMNVFGKDDAPHGHMHIKFDDVRVPKENILMGEARASKSPSFVSDPAASTIACAPSVRRKRRST